MASHKALDASVEALLTTLKTAVSSAVQDVVGRPAARAAKPIAEAAATLVRDKETDASAASSIRKNLNRFSATLFAVTAVGFILMGLATHYTTRWAVADSRAALVAVSDRLLQLDQAAEARKAYIVTLNAQISEISSEQLCGLIWDSCNGRYCIRVASETRSRASLLMDPSSHGLSLIHI